MKINPEGKCEEKYRRKCEEKSPTSCCEGKLSAMWAGWFLVRFPRPILVDSLLHRLHLLSPDPAHKPVGAVENLERFRKEIAWLSINFIFSTSWVALYSVVCLWVKASVTPDQISTFSNKYSLLGLLICFFLFSQFVYHWDNNAPSYKVSELEHF